MKSISEYLVLMLGFAVALPAQDQVVISGFVDASAAIPVADGTNLGFSFDGLEIDLTKSLGDDVSLRADIDLGEGTADVEQAYMSFRPFKIDGIATPVITVGKFNAPIGYELLDAPDMYQFSHSLVFDNALPTNLSGVSISQQLQAGLDLVVYVANGWDVNFADDDKVIFGGRLGYGGIEGVSLGASAIQNDNQDLIVDLDGEVTLVPNLTLGFEYNTGGAEDGWLVMANYAFSSFAVTVRQDAWGALSSTTISPSFGIAEGAGMLLEYRLDDNGDGTSSATTAIEFTFSF